MKRLPERVFGGKAAIWLVQKRRCVATQPIEQPLRWDDERGRRIYDEASAPMTEKSQGSPEKKVDNPSPKRQQESTAFSPISIKRAMFGSRKFLRRRCSDLFLASDLDMPLQLGTHSSPPLSMQHDDQANKPSTTSIGSSSNHNPSQCLNHSEPSFSDLGYRGDENTQSDVLKFEPKGHNINSAPVSNEKSVVDFDQTDDDTATLQQPYSNTPLDVARAYFERLDKSPIPLENVNKSEPSPFRAVVRTSHRLKPTNPIVTSEYAKYEETCKEADVKPIPIATFLKHRHDFVRHDGLLYEGFLYD
jgi:hypothetical protein